MYTIKILSNADFDLLPYKDARDALGLADAKRGVAYVRDTGIKGFTQKNLEHELDELLQKVSPHEEDGIRYKKGGFARFVVPALLGFVPVVGPYLAAAASIGMNQYAQSRHPEQLGRPGQFLDIVGQGLSGYASGAGASNFAKGFSGGGGFAGGLKGALGFGTADKAASSVSKLALPSSLVEPVGGAATSFGGASGNINSAFQAVKHGSNAAGISGVFAPAASASIAAQLPNQALSLSKAGNPLSIFDSLKKSTDVLSTGQTLAQKFLSRPALEGSSLSAFAGDDLLNFTVPGDTESPTTIKQDDVTNAFTNINRNAKLRTRNVFDEFRMSSPGASIEGNSAFQKRLASVAASSEKARSDFLSQADEFNKQSDLLNRYNAIQKTNKLTASQMSTLIGLLNKSDSEIEQAVNLPASQFRQVFSGMERFV